MDDKVFIVIELQTTGTSVAHIVTKFTDRAKAIEKYFQILAAAVVSKVPVHTAVIMTETGQIIRAEYFKHESEATE